LTKRTSTLLQRGLAHHQAREYEQARLIYKRVLATDPKHFDALHLLGVIAAQSGEPELAVDLIGQAIKVNALHAQAYFNLGNALKVIGRLEDALKSFNSALSINPNFAEASNARGRLLMELGRSSEALDSFDVAIALRSNYADAFFNRGLALQMLGRIDDALISLDQAILIKSDHAEAINNRGVLFKIMGRLDEALICYSVAMKLKPENAEFVVNLANTLRDLGRHEEAFALYGNAISIKPDYAEALLNQGVAFQELRRFEEALNCYGRAIELSQTSPEAFNNKGGVLQELGHFESALDCYESAIRLRPNYVQAFVNRASVLQKLMHLGRAFDDYKQASAIDPNYEFLAGLTLHSQLRLCDWTELPSQLLAIEAGIRQGRSVASPFAVLAVLDKPELQLLASRIVVNAKNLDHPQKVEFRSPVAGEKIRIGYFSADFYNHATTYLMAELFESHDPNRFEVYGFSFGPNTDDEMHRRIKAGFYRFLDVSNKSDCEVSKISREIGIEIAIDLKGFTHGARTRIFGERCAPIQVNYLGYPGTMGASFIDYIIADQAVIPAESRKFYAEKVVYLPGSYQVNDSTRRISDRVFHRSEAGLPEHGFVFCCFNNSYKILPEMFDVWMRLLRTVKGSVLWLLEDNLIAAGNLRFAAVVRDVDPTRLVFAKRLPNAEHLARHRLADLFLDTFPCNAHTTMSDALWSGLPALTLLGQSFSARVAASLLTAVDLSDLIAETFAEYESKAIELATNSSLLAGLRTRLDRTKQTSPLFDGKRFARDFEIALVLMSERYRSGQDPDHLLLCA